MTNGIEFAYNGTDISKASDYSKVIDSRWKFLEVALEGTILIDIPAIASGGASNLGNEQSFPVASHNLEFYPLFEATVTLINGTLAGSPPSQTVGTAYSDKNSIYVFPTYDTFDGQNAITIEVAYRVYKLDVSQSYEAPIQPFESANGKESDFGAKFLDGTVNNVHIQDSSPVGFSLDTTKKILSIHSISTVFLDLINPPTIIYHTVGYPPTYMMCLSPTTPFSAGFSTRTIPHRYNVYVGAVFIPVANVTATESTLQIKGIQSLFGGNSYTFVILKDPIQIAK